jgi:predicted nucleotide-binding protein (sugar kinase/HSP70/actin superfamily)
LKIGIPRALLYSIYLPLWKTFLEELGHTVILSNHTDQNILDNGVKNCVDDACLPVKIFHGHVTALAGRTDVILIPRLVSVYPGEFICPKFIGLPEMIKHSVPCNPGIIIMNFNARFSMDRGYDGMRNLGRELGATKDLVAQALDRARIRQAEHMRRMEAEPGFNPVRSIDKKDQKPPRLDQGIIGLIGHPYLVYDRYINMNICDKLNERGYGILFPENIPAESVDRACNRYPKKLFWSYGKRLLGSGLCMLENKLVDGLILLTSFGCGIDAFIDELLIRANHREYKIPLTTITLDEHTGQAGFDTRLEAFIDMMEWRSRYDNHVPTYGTGVYPGKSLI